MNILCLDQFGDLGGAQRCLLDLIPAMTGQGWGVHVAAPGGGAFAERAPALGATFDAIGCGPYTSGSKTLADMGRFLAEAPRLAGEIRALTRRYAADVIYINGPRLLPAAALAACKKPGVLFHSHSLLSGMARQLAGRSLTVLQPSIVAACRFVAKPLRPFAGKRGIRVVYNGVRPMPLSNRLRNEAEFRIGVIGRISPEKGQADFLRAARILHVHAPACRFVVCGAPLFSDPAAIRYFEGLKDLAVGLPLEFAGWTEDIENTFAKLDLLVVPSTTVDATPRVILEAFASGVPVMAFASGGIPEIVEDGVTGFLVPERSPEALANSLSKILEKPHCFSDVVENARAKALTDFSLDRYRTEMLTTIESVGRWCP